MLNWGCVFSRILGTYFRETTSPGLLVYEEFIVADKPLDRNARREVGQENRESAQADAEIASVEVSLKIAQSGNVRMDIRTLSYGLLAK